MARGTWWAGHPGAPGGQGAPGCGGGAADAGDGADRGSAGSARLGAWAGLGSRPRRSGRSRWPGGWRGRMERGVLRYLLLAALRDGPKHGYELIKWLEGRTHGLYSPSPGTVYPTLQLLEDQGLVRAESQEERRVYHLTDAGRAELEAHAGTVEAVWSRFAGQAPSEASRHEAAFLQDELQDLHRTVWEGLRGAHHAGDGETVRQVRQALERCKNEVREIIARAARTSGGGGPAGAGEAPGAPGRRGAGGAAGAPDGGTPTADLSRIIPAVRHQDEPPCA